MVGHHCITSKANPGVQEYENRSRRKLLTRSNSHGPKRQAPHVACRSRCRPPAFFAGTWTGFDKSANAHSNRSRGHHRWPTAIPADQDNTEHLCSICFRLDDSLAQIQAASVGFDISLVPRGRQVACSRIIRKKSYPCGMAYLSCVSSRCRIFRQ
jgi:hypothetical protein